MIKPIAITMGDPAGIGGEIILKAWTKRKEKKLPVFFVIDNIERLKSINLEIPIAEISSPSQAASLFNEGLPVLNIDLSAKPILGTLNSLNSQAVIQSIEKAVEFCLRDEASALVTNPIQKAALYDVGFDYPGHTEFVAALCNKNETPVMMLAAKDLRVVPLTVHIPLKDVPTAVTENLIVDKARIIHHAMRYDFKFINPRIAIAGLNPHAGEGGKIGLEDEQIIVPAIKKLMAENIHAMGPFPADTLFHEEARQNYDVAIGMYHDQALIPLKTLDFHGGVNITLGLSVVRTSPDHGTALNIAGKGIARADSLMNAILMAETIANNRNL